MMSFLRRILLTLIGLAGLVVVEQAFGMTTAIVVTGVCFLGYIAWLTLRQMAEEDDDGA
jgi:threonine/homoserine/homoserine lactone efflux protein